MCRTVSSSTCVFLARLKLVRCSLRARAEALLVRLCDRFADCWRDDCSEPDALNPVDTLALIGPKPPLAETATLNELECDRCADVASAMSVLSTTPRSE